MPEYPPALPHTTRETAHTHLHTSSPSDLPVPTIYCWCYFSASFSQRLPHDSTNCPTMLGKHSGFHRLDRFLSANAHSDSHTLVASQRGVLPPVWSGARAAFPLTARCMQLNHIKVISPAEVIASRWLAHKNMLLMKLLSHCGCVLVWQSMHDCTHVYVMYMLPATSGCDTRRSSWLDGGWSLSCWIAISVYC